MEPSDLEYNNNAFGRRFGIPITDDNSLCAKRASNRELLLCYSIPGDIIPSSTNAQHFSLCLDDNMHYCIPFCLCSYMTNILLANVDSSTDITFNVSKVSDNFQCYQMTGSPTAPDWVLAYKLDPSTCAMYNAFI